MANNVNWTEIPNKDVLRFSGLSHIQNKKRGIPVKDFVEVYLRCEFCDKIKKFGKVETKDGRHVWDLKDWKTFMRKVQVSKDEVRGSGYYISSNVIFCCPNHPEIIRELIK